MRLTIGIAAIIVSSLLAMSTSLAARGESDHAEHVAANEQSESPPPTRDR